MIKTLIGATHERLVFNRRVRVLSDKISALVPSGASLLDVGSGDGQIARDIANRSGCADVAGLDVMLRPDQHIAVQLFDGMHIPHEANSFDVVSLVDVLHHADAPVDLLKEAARVARGRVIIKDHLSETALDHATLRLMDWVGNAPHGVVLPYNYASRTVWTRWFADAGLTPVSFDTDVPLYRFPVSLVFGRRLHFVAALRPDA